MAADAGGGGGDDGGADGGRDSGELYVDYCGEWRLGCVD